MTTELKRFTEAYATMTVAAYEPLILRWISLIGIRFISNAVAYRLPKAAAIKFDGKTPAALALSKTLRKPLPTQIDFEFRGQEMRVPIDIHGRAIPPEAIQKVEVPNFPNAVAIGKDVYLNGFSITDPAHLTGEQGPNVGEAGAAGMVGAAGTAAPAASARRFNSFTQGLKTIPMAVSNRLGARQPDFDFMGTRDGIQDNLMKAAQEWVAQPDKDLMQLMLANTNFRGTILPHMWPGAISIHEALSPIGIAHYFRQLYFNKEEGVGPIEEAFTVAPLETLEVIYQTVRKQIHEEILEQGLEVVSEQAVEEKNLDEVSDKVSSMVQQDVSASMSANASGGVGVWQVGASASASFGVSSQRSREYSTRRLKEVTKRASERITKSFSIKTRDTTEVTETTTTRRVIRNESPQPVSYGLRRVLRRVAVKVQDLGPRLVWQLYLRNPGTGLARSRFVHFRETGPITVPEIPPGVPPRPSGGVESESTSTSILYDSGRKMYYVTIVVKPGDDRDVAGVRIDNITDLEGGGKDDLSPAPHNEFDLGSTWDPGTRTYTAKLGVLPGDSAPVQVNYSYVWKPSESVMAAWEAQRQAAVAKITEEALQKQFEQNKALITEKSKIKSRPANDLRREERYEVMNRMVSYLFGRGDDPSDPTPLEIEYFHRYFDIDGIFTYTHPSWWKPRFASKTVGLEREAYEITAESDPAPLGSSLGWLIQLDGDRRRNEFLNSPWARICIPMRRGREREAIQWLAKHMEGEVGYDVNSGPLAGLLTEIDQYRGREDKLGMNGADWVTVESTPGAPADPAKPEGVYPVVDEFDVTVPTDGFVYDELKVIIP
ncbi:hypothetical protein SAMN05216299_1177 [Nitrosospira sp. Nsp14]|uniref:hypothetical protein n=1 Tax=Nitrosospira sp. Nsp14 TaxID=1855333 RepID=UPI0008E4D8A0|nr:hypothetical protein [Nitrosospira sp. Nsp14]SFH49962.1 hypothetical protein SAMN05216299_1177 [Nitrosospira sp. Nsp14]